MIEKIKELERIIEILDQEGVDKCEKLEAQAKQIKQLEKALDKACEELEYTDHFNGVNYDEVKSCFTKEQWKEYLLKG